MNKFIKKFLNNFESISNYYNYLVDKTKQKEYLVEPKVHWLRRADKKVN
jgi:hypothetical protein